MDVEKVLKEAKERSVQHPEDGGCDCSMILDCIAAVEQLKLENVLLRESFVRYAGHRWRCASHLDGKCDCGIIDAIIRIDGLKGGD